MHVVLQLAVLLTLETNIIVVEVYLIFTSYMLSVKSWNAMINIAHDIIALNVSLAQWKSFIISLYKYKQEEEERERERERERDNGDHSLLPFVLTIIITITWRLYIITFRRDTCSSLQETGRQHTSLQRYKWQGNKIGLNMCPLLIYHYPRTGWCFSWIY